MRRIRPIRPLEDSRRVLLRGLLRVKPISPKGGLRFLGRPVLMAGRFVTKAD